MWGAGRMSTEGGEVGEWTGHHRVRLGAVVRARLVGARRACGETRDRGPRRGPVELKFLRRVGVE